ncbi:MAG: metallophosphoesterase [Carboxylicivirga sp.]|jgi:predicted phosphodiesterase|nr:metallophosphoesterase [Carboxylicivirga sp.]
MDRRKFIKRGLQCGLVLTIPMAGCSFNRGKSAKVSFGLSTDIHIDMMPDSKDRIQTYLTHMKQDGVDFLIDLGDFCHPVPANKKMVDYWRSFGLETHYTLGNHDMDKGTKEDYMAFVGMKKRYYSFDRGGVHCVVLDPNNLFVEGSYIPYANANFYKPSEQRAYIDPEQLEWLKHDLSETNNPSLIFSHQSFENPSACKNQGVVRKVLEQCNQKAGYTKVVACFSGHDHTDVMKEINGIHYIQINSMSYNWVGAKYQSEARYSDEIHKQFPHLKSIIPYKDPLYAKIIIDNGQLKLEGIQSRFVPPTPRELGIDSDFNGGLPLVPMISNRTMDFPK